jgi:hypothetical protein
MPRSKPGRLARCRSMLPHNLNRTWPPLLGHAASPFFKRVLQLRTDFHEVLSVSLNDGRRLSLQPQTARASLLVQRNFSLYIACGRLPACN